MKSLFESLHLDDSAPIPESAITELSGKAFSQAVLDSREFREYIVNGIKLRDIPSPILCRLIDHGWGKPPEKVELTGKDGQPIEAVTEVRRVIVHAKPFEDRDELVTH